MLVAATISVCFNAVTVVMWRADFGRTGALLEGAPAAERLKRAKALANRTGGFISLVDRELLQSMSPEQLEVLSARARARQHKAAAKAGLGAVIEARRDRTLRIEIGAEAAGARQVAEGVLSSSVKRFEMVSEAAEGSGSAIVYRVRLKKSTTGDEFIEGFRAAVGGAITKAELVD